MEELIRFVRYVLVFWGLVYILTQSAIFIPVRKLLLKYSSFFATLIYCPACTGFWVGLAFGLLGIYGKGLSNMESVVMVESALSGTALGYLWGAYWGDDHAIQRDLHSLEKEKMMARGEREDDGT